MQEESVQGAAMMFVLAFVGIFWLCVGVAIGHWWL